MTRLALLFVVLAAPAFAQTPLALPQFADPPESNGAPYTTYNRHILWNSGQVCLQRSTSTSWQCLSTAAQTEAARASAVSQAVSQAASNAAAIYMTTATGNAGFAAANSRIDTTNSSLSTTQTQVAGLQSTSATTAALSSAVATLNTRIDGVQASIIADSVCTNTTVASAITVPALGLSVVATTPLPGAIAGAPCTVGSTAFPPLGGSARCIASAANTIQLRFEGALLTFPSGVYRQCVQIRP